MLQLLGLPRKQMNKVAVKIAYRILKKMGKQVWPERICELSAAPEKSVEEVNAITDIVKDSSRKIFIAGISKALSSEMLMEIVNAFGPLGAFRFEYNEELDGPCAFLEYIDLSTTLKACAGLNGMKLGGCILTVVQALPDAPEEGNSEASLFYGIPMHARPLLAESTNVLQLKNVDSESSGVRYTSASSNRSTDS